MFFLSLKGIGIGNWESAKVSGEDEFVAKVCKLLVAPTVIDLGANVGNYSNSVRRLSPSAQIFAFEPHPSTFSALAVAARTHGYQAVNMACSDIVGEALLFDHSNADSELTGTEHASLIPNVIESVHASRSSSFTVEVTTLDAVVNDLGVDTIDLLKIDVEGAELKVLRGARGLLSMGKISIIQFEFTEAAIQTRVFMRDFVELLRDYAMFRMLPDGLVSLGEYHPPIFEIFGYQNIVAIRRELAHKFD